MAIVSFQVAREVFVQGMNNADHQKHRLKEDVHVEVEDLITIDVQGGKITEEGVRMNSSVALNYIHLWLQVRLSLVSNTKT
jgi:malate synthase